MLGNFSDELSLFFFCDLNPFAFIIAMDIDLAVEDLHNNGFKVHLHATKEFFLAILKVALCGQMGPSIKKIFF